MASSDCLQLWRPTRVKLSLGSQNKGPPFRKVCQRRRRHSVWSVHLSWSRMGRFCICTLLITTPHCFVQQMCMLWLGPGWIHLCSNESSPGIASCHLKFASVCCCTWVANQWQWHVTCRLAATFTIWSKKQQRNNGMGSSLRTMLTATWMCVVQDRLPSQWVEECSECPCLN